MSEIVPFLWFDNCAEEAVDFYLGVFPDGRRIAAPSGPDGTPGKRGPMAAQVFEVNSLRLIAFNGGPGHPFNDAISFSVSCADQTEIDRIWQAFLEGGGSPIACGWLKDRFGVRWQVVPRNIAALLARPGAVQAMMKMTKLDIAVLEAAQPNVEPEDTPKQS